MFKKVDEKKLKLLTSQKLKLIEGAPDAFYKAATAQEKRLLAEIDKLIGELDTKDGLVQTTQRNVNLINDIEKKLKKSFYKSEYIDAVDEMISTLDQVKDLTKEYFETGFGKVKSKAADIAFGAKKAEVFGILAGTSSVDAVLFNPVKQLLTDSVANGVTFSELTNSIKTIVTGNDEVDGKLTKYAKQIASDTFSTSERNYTKALSEYFEVQFYRYQGGEIDSTRCFCDERNGKYFHIEEIKSWGRGENVGDCGYPWAGMYKETNENNIMSWLGGYNCKHSLVPVSLVMVPTADLKRAIENGWFKPTSSERELLGL